MRPVFLISHFFVQFYRIIQLTMYANRGVLTTIGLSPAGIISRLLLCERLCGVLILFRDRAQYGLSVVLSVEK